MEFHTSAAIEISVSFIVEVLTLSFPDYFEVVISGVNCSMGGGHLYNLLGIVFGETSLILDR
jgi:hypothetical protein